MRRFAITVALVLAIAATALGQCPGGVCPTQPPAPPQYEIIWTPSPPPQQEKAPLASHFSATVRIRNDIGRIVEGGSGVYVQDSGYVFVLTCAHLFSDGVGNVTVRFSDGKTVKATLLDRDVIWDMAILKVPAHKGIKPAMLSTTLPKQGDVLASCGYGPNDTFKVNRGRMLGYTGPGGQHTKNHWLNLTGPSRSGDSGGPIFTSDGKVAGVLWGTTGSTTMGPCVPRLRLLIRRVLARVAGAGKAVVGGAGRILCPPKPQKPLVPCPPQVTENCDALRARVAALEKRVAALEAFQDAPGVAGERGPAGPQGAAGEKGLNGDRGDSGVSPSIDDIVDAVLSKLPKSSGPITYKIVPRKQ